VFLAKKLSKTASTAYCFFFLYLSILTSEIWLLIKRSSLKKEIDLHLSEAARNPNYYDPYFPSIKTLEFLSAFSNPIAARMAIFVFD